MKVSSAIMRTKGVSSESLPLLGLPTRLIIWEVVSQRTKSIGWEHVAPMLIGSVVTFLQYQNALSKDLQGIKYSYPHANKLF
ncbi:hypothetical protein SCA6_017114 [Theobroma cacao]